ncbi:hypothetical protein EXIGLDRAFT_765024 [Exidia glandulosa HHB12029]|uniref:Secreted protein n=1 Tax=Exidia glandulosa HHB12029 TaxID=1314781 RepID=A0A165KS78_EXIGL|nr:hypothetical protein EXIGLDRAFT_765024 [Exidia glandulosa HHB12029]
MFKPSVFSAVLIALSSLVTAMPTDKLSLGAIPAGFPNGFYAGHLKDDGSTQWELLVAHPENTTSNIEDPIVKSSLTKRDGFSCNGFSVNANDVAVAQTQFAANCGVSGYTFNARAIAYTYNSGVACGCNYAKSQTCYHDGVTNAFNLLSSEHCGADGAGWWSDTHNKASYGRTNNGGGYC